MFIMKLKILFIPLFFIFSLSYGQTEVCPFDENLYSGTVTTTTIGASKFKASDATSNYRFGERVAIDGNIAAVTSRSNGVEQGKVYIYINDGSGNWSQQTILNASNAFAGDHFGSSVALEGNYLLVGARFQLDTNDVDTGAAYLYEYDGAGTWTEVAIFEPSDGVSDDRFGESVSIEGDLILVGARNGSTGGCAYIYENDGTGTFTYSETKLEPQVQSNYSGARFGYNVKVADGKAYVSGPQDYSSVGKASAGSVQIWEQANDGTWSRTHRLRGTETSEYFGSGLDVEGDYLAVGAYNFEVSSTPEADQGRVYVYKADVNGDYLESNRVMIQNDDKDSYNDQRFGSNVVIDGDFLYVSSFGNGSANTDAVYIFKNDGTNNWSQISKITSGSGWDEFANRSVAVSFPNIIIGQNEDDSPSNSGAVYFASLASNLNPTASVSEVVRESSVTNDGIIKVSFSDEATKSTIEFSIDNGVTYTYSFDDSLGTGEINSLSAGDYNVWARFDASSCAVNLGTITVEAIEYTTIPDSNFEAELNSLGYDDIVGDGLVPTELIENITVLNVSNKSISDLTGIQDFTALTDLNVETNTLTSLDVSNNSNLQNLNFDNNNVATLNLGSNSNLSSIEGRYNQLTTIDLSQIPNLTFINVRDNLFTTVDVSNNTLLSTLNLRGCSNLTTLDVSNNSELVFLYLQDTALTGLDVTSNTKLEVLIIERVNFSSIDVSNLLLLRQLRIGDNSFTELDVSNNPLLERLECENNNLTYLNLKNGNNTAILNSNFIATGNSSLTCITVDDPTWSTTNWTNIDGTASFNLYCSYTSIPDVNFEARLEALGYDNISGDGQVPTGMIEGITNLNISNQSISNLTGIEDFESLETLVCAGNPLATYDFSQNNNLQTLNINSCGISSIDVSKNTALRTLVLYGNQLTSIDITQNTDLREFDIFQNKVTSLDLTQNLQLRSVLVEDNDLTTLDIRLNTLVTELNCASNELTSLIVRNGNNSNFTSFVANNNSNLSCISVDDVSYATTNWTNIDATAYFTVLDCRYTTIPDSNFESALEALGYDDFSADGKVPTELIEVVTSLDVGTKNINDLTGIEAFSALTSLRCNDNAIQNLDLRNNTLLEYIKCDDNNMDILNVEGLQYFEELVGYGNDFTSFDFSNVPSLKKISLFNNELTSLDLTKNTALVFVRLDNNNLTSLDLRNGTNTNITNFNATLNSNLACIAVDDAAYSTTNWTDRHSNTSFSETTCPVNYDLSLRVFLQGAHINPNTGEESIMRDDLRVSNVIPTTSPYTDGATCNSSIFTATGSDAIVDWVWVELRDKTDHTIVLTSQSGLIQRDGDIVAIDGSSPLSFSLTENNDVYISINHRSHLGILTASSVILSESGTTIDFTADTSLVYGNSNAVIVLSNGAYGLISGDFDGNGQVQNIDVNGIITLLGSSGYNGADMDMNGQIQNSDINNLINPNSGKGEQF